MASFCSAKASNSSAERSSPVMASNSCISSRAISSSNVGPLAALLRLAGGGIPTT